MRSINKIIQKSYGIKGFEFFYFFLMVIYMAYMTPETRVTTGGVMTRTVAFSIPPLFTIILLARNRVRFNARFRSFLYLMIIWIVIQMGVKDLFNGKDIINYIYYLYAYIFAYIHFTVYGKSMFPLYEKIMVFFAKLSLVIWFFTVLTPELAMQVARLFPKTLFGHNFLYLINWVDTEGIHVFYGFIRNSGCAWESGRFSIMLCLALLINLYEKGITFRKNSNVMWLLFALLTTMSTTGYIIMAVMYGYFFLKKLDLKTITLYCIIYVPLLYGAYQLEFIGDKLENSMDVYTEVEHIEESWEWTEKHNENEGTAYSMDRFPSMFFEYQNFLHDPIIGYGANRKDSYFSKTYTEAIGFCGGLTTVLAVHGIFLGLLLYYFLYRASLSISSEFNSKKRYGFFIYAILSSISYPLLYQNLYTAMWFYGYFKNDKKKRIR